MQEAREEAFIQCILLSFLDDLEGSTSNSTTVMFHCSLQYIPSFAVVVVLILPPLICHLIIVCIVFGLRILALVTCFTFFFTGNRPFSKITDFWKSLFRIRCACWWSLRIREELWTFLFRNSTLFWKNKCTRSFAPNNNFLLMNVSLNLKKKLLR